MRFLHYLGFAAVIVALAAAIILISPVGPLSTTVENARMQCVVDGEVIFDQRFDVATINPFGTITVRIGGTSAVIDGPDCHVVQP
jgi:hypothetical protein